jgi:hypothetical protein
MQLLLVALLLTFPLAAAATRQSPQFNLNLFQLPLIFLAVALCQLILCAETQLPAVAVGLPDLLQHIQ